MVYDGYYGGFVPVDAASFDVTLEPEVVVLLPLSVLEEQRTAAEALERHEQARAARRLRPRCDAGDHPVQTVTRASDGLLALCSRCSEGVELTTLDSPALIDILVARVPEAERAHRRRALERRLMARRHERELATAASADVRCAGDSAASCRAVTAPCGPAAAVRGACRLRTWTDRPRPKPWPPAALLPIGRLPRSCWRTAPRRMASAASLSNVPDRHSEQGGRPRVPSWLWLQ